MNEKFIQEMITELGNTIAQQVVDLTALRISNKELQQEVERLNQELVKSKMDEVKGADSVEQ